MSSRKINIELVDIIDDEIEDSLDTITDKSIKMRQKGSGVNTGEDTKYVKLSQVDHIYKICDTYTGSDEASPRSEMIIVACTNHIIEDIDHGLDLMKISPSAMCEDVKMDVETISVPETVERTYLEILSNASDNVERTRKSGLPVGKILVTMDRRRITIINYGNPVPLDVNNDEGVPIPQMIFGELLTSSNYTNTDRTVCGRNGYGAKLTNIFSTSFEVIIISPVNREYIMYQQRWNSNMKKCDDPVTSKINVDKLLTASERRNGCGITYVSYELDFERFGYEEYPDEAFSLFMKHACDTCFINKIPTVFNGILLCTENIIKYASLMSSSTQKPKYAVHYQWDDDVKTEDKSVTGMSYKIKVAKDPTVNPIIELHLLDTPHSGKIISFANGICTRNGGKHVDAVLLAIRPLIEELNKTMGKTEKKFKLTITDLKAHISMIVNARIPNPKFDGQMKCTLTNGKIKVDLSPSVLKNMKAWECMSILKSTLEIKNLKTLTKSDGSKKKRVFLLKGEDANEAGKKNSHKCTLYVTEGKSAMGYGIKMISITPGGRDFNGILPLQGKPLNVMNASIDRISANTEIKELKQMMGLKEGVDYGTEVNRMTLRYGKIGILKDADEDGNHITSLVLNYFYCRFKGLLKSGMVGMVQTPIVRVSKSSNIFKFYSHTQHNTWLADNSAIGWTVKYYKGLGSSRDDEIEDDQKDRTFIDFAYDEKSDKSMVLAFDKKLADDRKHWILGKDYTTQGDIYHDLKIVEEVELTEMSTGTGKIGKKLKTMNLGNKAINYKLTRKQMDMSSFVYTELAEYSLLNLRRSIPKLFDGLKVSQRKIVWACTVHWKGKIFKKPPVNTSCKELSGCPTMKTAGFATKVVETTNYHHGEQCLGDAIVGMAHSYTGSNNLPYLAEDGQFGTRNLAGDAAKMRYSSTRPKWWFPLVYRKEDQDILEFEESEGIREEPKYMMPIIPMVLVNGARGIATGFSTFIPCHNPVQIVNILLHKIHPSIYELEDTMEKIDVKDKYEQLGINDGFIQPWYKGYTGDVVIVGKKVGSRSFGNLFTEDEFPKRMSSVVEMMNEEFGDECNSFKKLRDFLCARESVRGKHIRMICNGVCTESPKEIIISEIPIGVSIHNYNILLDLLVESKDIKDFDNKSTHDKPLFIVIPNPNFDGNKLSLSKSFGMTNMVLLDEEGYPATFSSTMEILDAFHDVRLKHYIRRKNFQLKNIAAKIASVELLIKFIQLYLDETIIILKKSRKEIIYQLRDHELPDDMLKISISSLTVDHMRDSVDKLTLLQKEYEAMENRDVKDIWKEELLELRKHLTIRGY